MHGAVLRVAFMAKILAIHVAKTDLVRISRLNVPIRRLIETMMGIVVSVWFVISTTQKFAVMIEKLNGNTKASGRNGNTSPISIISSICGSYSSTNHGTSHNVQS